MPSLSFRPYLEERMEDIRPAVSLIEQLGRKSKQSLESSLLARQPSGI